MPDTHLQYIFDPLCSWCYACAPALAAISKRWSATFEMLPCGLFSEHGARVMNPEWARYAWDNDQRIGGMTGQIFSQRYREQVLAKTEGKIDSSAMNRALTQAHTIDSTLEPKLLSALQVARYMQGQDTCDYPVVAGIAAQLLIGAGHETTTDTLSVRLFADEDLAKRTHARTSTAQALIGRFDLRGIPQLLVRTGNITLPLNSSHLYQGVEKLITEIRKTVDSAQVSVMSPRNLAHGRR